MSNLEMVLTAVSVLASEMLVLTGLVCVLVCSAFIVGRTGQTAGLRDLAATVRAFSHVGTFRMFTKRKNKK